MHTFLKLSSLKWVMGRKWKIQIRYKHVMNYKLYFPCQVFQKASEAGWGDVLEETPHCRLYCAFKLTPHLFWGVLPWHIWEQRGPKLKLHLEKGRGKNFLCVFHFSQHYTSRCHTPWGANAAHIDCWHQPSHRTKTLWKPASPGVTHDARLLEFQSNKRATKKKTHFAMQPTPVSATIQDTTLPRLRARQPPEETSCPSPDRPAHGRSRHHSKHLAHPGWGLPCNVRTSRCRSLPASCSSNGRKASLAGSKEGLISWALRLKRYEKDGERKKGRKGSIGQV